MARSELKPEDLTAICDTREKTPLDLSPLTVERGTLVTGDYSVKGLESVIAIERKSLQDLIGCIGRDRERFEREVMRLIAYETRAIVVEADFGALERREYRGAVSPSAAMGSVLGWVSAGLPVLFAGDHERAGRMVSRLLFIAARRRWREAQAFTAGLKLA